jgi:hypothetical protein
MRFIERWLVCRPGGVAGIVIAFILVLVGAVLVVAFVAKKRKENRLVRTRSYL